MTDKTNSRMDNWTRRDLLKGVVAAGVTGGLVEWTSPWKMQVQAPLFQTEAIFQFPEEEESWSWSWKVQTPDRTLLTLGSGTNRKSEFKGFTLQYPFESSTVHGQYSYWLELNGRNGFFGRTEPIHVHLTPYRFGC